MCVTLPWLAVPGGSMCCVFDVTMVGCTRRRYVLCVGHYHGLLYQAEVCVVCLTLPWLAVPGGGMCCVCDVTMVGCTRRRYVLCV